MSAPNPADDTTAKPQVQPAAETTAGAANAVAPAANSAVAVKGTEDKEATDMVNLLFGRNRKPPVPEGHKFWNTQPVPQDDPDVPKDASQQGPIETKTVDEVQKAPYNLPGGFEWSDCDITDQKILDEVYTLLSENYVEDDDNMFRFDYSRDFLRWALTPPGYLKQLHVGVRVAANKKLVGFITGIPAHIRVYKQEIPMVEINFLCVHKKLRSKRLAPVLIKEVTRRVNLTNVWQAVYTAGVVLPRPVGKNRYYHRSLNPKKLIDVGFSRLSRNQTLARLMKLYKVSAETKTPGIRELKESDIPQAAALLAAYQQKFDLTQRFDETEFKHWFLTRPGVVYCFVVEDPQTHKLTDMVSFYALPSSIINHEKYKTLNAAYSFYNVSTKTPWVELMSDCLVLAKQRDFDVFNALNVMENMSFLTELKFGIGDGCLQYYLYNWRCPEMEPNHVGLVLL